MADAQKEGDLTLQASIQDYSLEIQRYQANIQKYQAESGIDIQEYQQEIGEKTLEYQWKSERLNILMQEYMTFYGVQAPQQQEKPQSRRGR